VNGGAHVASIIAIVAALGLATIVVVVALITGRTDPSSTQLIVTVLGVVGTVVAVLSGGLMVTGNVSKSVDGVVTKLVNTASATAFQRGQEAGPGPLPVNSPEGSPPATSTLPPPP
jgi:hypothetical protein